MGHVDHQVSTHFIGDLAELVPVDDLAVSRRPRHDQLGLDFLSLSQDGVVIQFLGFGTEFVTVGVVKLPGEINLGTVG